MTRYWSVMIAVLALVACGDKKDDNAAGGGNPGSSPFGLTQRASLPAFALPVDDGTLASGYTLVEPFPNLSFSAATFLSGIPGDTRLAVMEQAGRIRVFEPDPAVGTTRTILDISSEILFDREQGLIGLAFDPAFASNRYLYVHYSLENPRRSVIARFTWSQSTDRVDLASRKILLTLDQPFTNHNGGMLAFGPDDDYLYIAFGDGGNSNDPGNRAQDLGNWFGTLLRIDVHPQNPADPYDIPPDNPYVGDPNARDEIWVHGLRNPFRFSFDRSNGTLWLGDVGQNAVEEVDIIRKGENYGWRVYEGDQENVTSGNTLPRSAFTFPVHTYPNSGGGAVIGGYVYRGLDVPSLRGRYLYADFVTGRVWALAYDGTSVTANDQIATATSPTSFGETNDGEVYLVTQGSGVFAFQENAGGGGGGNVPDQLSETGLFTDLANLTPAPGLVEYDLNQPFWSDGAVKRRWIGIPDGRQIGFSDTGAWTFPPGTVIVKHFELALTEGDPASQRRLETRVLTNPGGDWQGFTYRWNQAETDATLVTGGASEIITVQTASGSRDQLYEYPSPTDCGRCHTAAAGFVLGVRTRQLNRDLLYAGTNVTDNQLRAFNHVGLFSGDIGAATQYDAFPDVSDAGAPLEARARTYLAVNCGQCHRPGGPTGVDLDLRFDTANANMNAIGVAPSRGGLGVADPRIIAPGDRDRSVLWLRLQRLDANRMPPLASHVVDEDGAALIGNWIDTL